MHETCFQNMVRMYLRTYDHLMSLCWSGLLADFLRVLFPNPQQIDSSCLQIQKAALRQIRQYNRNWRLLYIAKCALALLLFPTWASLEEGHCLVVGRNLWYSYIATGIKTFCQLSRWRYWNSRKEYRRTLSFRQWNFSNTKPNSHSSRINAHFPCRTTHRFPKFPLHWTSFLGMVMMPSILTTTGADLYTRALQTLPVEILESPSLIILL